jgi:alpha-galactosidase
MTNLTTSFRRIAPSVLLMFCAAAAGVHLRAQKTNPVPSELSAQVFGSVAPLPPMGWASWNHFFCDYDEKTIRAEADALVSSGMRDAGYKYVVIQECISRERDRTGNLIVDAVRFPSGMPALVAYIHKLGLDAGIYTDIGRHTCYPNPRYEGSYGHEEQDARTFAAWGIDFVEMDYCNRVPEHTGRYVYEKMAAAIRATGRPMVFYLCCWGNEQPWEWAQGDAQMWRTEFDISLEKNHVEWTRLVGNFKSNTAHAVFSAPESWNDADMLEIGNPGLNDEEAQAQMSMWVMSPSPLLAGADLTQMTARTKQIYTNPEVIAIDQDPLGAGARIVAHPSSGVELWERPLGSWTAGDIAVMLLNASHSSASMRISWSELGLLPGAKARDLWKHRDLPAGDGYEASVAPHSATLLRVHGRLDWRHQSILEAETPSNERLGSAVLFPCGECSSGYAMQIGGDGHPGGIRFDHIQADKSGTYELTILYVRNGLEDKMLSVSVNGAAPLSVRAIMRSWNVVTLPVPLHAGDNSIAVTYTGALPLDLDRIALVRASQ